MQMAIFLSSGLFLGWSLGANDAANVFGTAVGTRMISFRLAAAIASVAVIVGAVSGGSGGTETLGKLGSVGTMPGAFTVALAAAFTVFWMTRIGLPVSTSQAIVGAIIGWNFYAGLPTDTDTLTRIVSTWVLCPVLSALFAVLFFFAVRGLLRVVRVGIFRQDAYTRFALAAAGAFGAYSLGANNIANVMGVFAQVPVFEPAAFFGVTVGNTVQLFALGGVAIAVGIVTYSKRVMETVGAGIFRLSPVTAFVVVMASSTVLFLFAAEGLNEWLTTRSLPALPLVPVSSSQAVVGAVTGIGIVKGGRNIRYARLLKIASGWVSTPVAAGVITFILLFFVENLFLLPV